MSIDFMKLSINWLKEYVTINKSADEIAETLTMIGNEVEDVITSGEIPGVIVAEIKEITPHPNADKLQLTKIDDGKNILNVVCGAPNIQEGQKIFLATVGTKLPDPTNNDFFEIKKSKIRGEISEGMICSEKELGISDDHDGIMVLPNDYRLGSSISDYFAETVLEIDVTPNRVDCLSIIGLARDLSAKYSQKLNFDYKVNYPSDENTSTIEILDKEICNRYTGIRIESVKIQESPDWLKKRLISIGERPINNVVDITNYVMFELGQPLHAFDYDKISGDKIYVRKSKAREKILTLDGESRELPEDSIVIADNKRPIGLAGIMGGQSSEISSNTTNVFLEAANFNSSKIRSTSKKLGLSTEASMRFERNLDPKLAIYGLSRAADLIVELAGGNIDQKIQDNFPSKTNDEKIILYKNKLKNHLGLDIPNKQIDQTLNNLNFQFTFDHNKEVWAINRPFWRTDIQIPEDIHEEIARIIGYDEIPLTYLSGSVPRWEPNRSLDIKYISQDLMVGAGLSESISYSAISEKQLSFTPNLFDLGEKITLSNPISKEYSVLRKSLIPSLISAASRNSNNWKGPIKLFEIGNVFFELESKVVEKTMLSAILTGPRQEISLNSESSKLDYFDIKGILEMLSKNLNFDFEVKEYDDKLFSEKSSLIYNRNIDENIGCMGELSKETIEINNFSSSEVIAFEIDLSKIIRCQDKFVYKDFSQYPQAHRDLSLIIDRNVNFSQIEKIVYSENLVEDCLIFDIYEGDEIPEGKRSISIRVNYQSPNETLSSKKLEKIEKNILVKLEKTLGIYIREQ
ncbi:MAG: phenylalanine--tRNA ligase subunit beta [Chloroflexi bacterium]|nr:phenylalanine--tRNA ligase subunit beta [Chloroflexota bacterium]